MKHLFVPYNIALLAKKKRFDNPSFGLYDNMEDLILDVHQSYEKIHGIRNSHLTNEVSAPLYQQLTDWFETKKIFISILYAAPDTNKFHYRIDDYNNNSFAKYSKEYYLTRVETQIKAFEEAFKLTQ